MHRSAQNTGVQRELELPQLQQCTKRVRDVPSCEYGPIDRITLGIRENCPGCPIEGSFVGKRPVVRP